VNAVSNKSKVRNLSVNKMLRIWQFSFVIREKGNVT